MLRAEPDFSSLGIFAILNGASRVALAVSGGSDSMALLRLVLDWLKVLSNPPHIFALTVDHSLRDASANEAMQVGVWCAALGVPHEILKWNHDHPQSGIQAKARKARYDLMTAWCDVHNVPVLMTGHTADDQAETVKMRSSRTSTAASLAGIWPERDWNEIRVVRPLLNLRREDLRSYLRLHHQNWIDDPSNNDVRFERVRVRQTLKGALGGFADHAQSAQAEIRHDQRLAETWCTHHLHIHELGFTQFRRVDFEPLNNGVQGHVVQRILNICGMRNSVELAGRLKLLEWLNQEAGTRRSLGGAVFAKRRLEIIVGREPGRLSQNAVSIPTSGEVIWDGRFRVTGPIGAIVTPRPQKPRQKDIPAFIQAGLPTVMLNGLILNQGVKYEFLRH